MTIILLKKDYFAGLGQFDSVSAGLSPPPPPPPHTHNFIEQGIICVIMNLSFVYYLSLTSVSSYSHLSDSPQHNIHGSAFIIIYFRIIIIYQLIIDIINCQ